MKCPKCNTKETQIRFVAGFTSEVVNECVNCECIFVVRNKNETKIIYKGNR